MALEVRSERSGRVAVITLDRPERMNTISGPMLDQLSAVRLAADRGGLPESDGTWLQTRLVGSSAAAEIFFTGETLDSE